jgi:hypothetical protein
MAMTVLPAHEVRERFLDRGLDLRIEGRRRLVEQEDRGVLQDHARNGDALALSAGELDAALADEGVEAMAPLAVDQLVDEAVRLRLAGRVTHHRLIGVGPSVEDVLADGAVQERGILRHQ